MELILITLGLATLIGGALSLNYADLCKTIQQHDQALWVTLGKPKGFAHHGIIVFNWLLSRGFEQTEDAAIQRQGALAYQRAQMSRRVLMLGLGLLIGGVILGGVATLA